VVVLLDRQGLEPGGVLPRHAPERLAVERDRRPLEIPEVPLLCEHLGQVVLARPTELDDDLAQPLAVLCAAAQGLVELLLVEVPAFDQERAERRPLRLVCLVHQRVGHAPDPVLS
jgi:hypothetical protein